ncbi:MAG TPA: dephospho-CoA kinase [Candidatus Dormibacteraeota bacterium]
MSRVIGLTGGIGSGKSTVAQLLAERGAWIVDADQLARAVVGQGSPALAEIAEAFGPGIIESDGSLDRAQLAQLVFAEDEARERLNRIVHPRVLELSREEIRQAEGAGAGLIAYDVPLLYETGREDEFDGVLVVWADPQTQLLRICRRTGLSEAEAKQRIAAQMPLSRKRELATWVIDNEGSPEQTRAQVQALWDAELAPGP